ncbi:hypothetical protein [Rhodococcoides kyotonense]|uniref:Uncharacterized protein n=1 Tax=Rhodococcoides kyotonense TaxID=398843 RepID=A0A239FDF4_9NOCA|nr:hypothetical protein [Rhodococcus kyotonensis]SNS54867.1 hypothetical protein SAMN05421642_103239 [Rhodococcus kyotonensis]
MTDINNPAHRLHHVLVQMKSLNPDIALKTTLEQFFETQRQNQLLRKLAMLTQLPEKAMDAITAVANRQELDLNGPQVTLYRSWYSNVVAAFKKLDSLGSPTSTVNRAYTTADLNSLQAAAFWISHQYPPTNAEDDIAVLRDRALDMAQLVRDCADLPADLRSALLQQIGRITSALDEAWLIGTEGLRTASDVAYGAIIRTLTHTGLPETQQGRTALHRVGQFVTAVGLVTGTIGGIAALPGQVESAVQVFTGTDALPTIEQPAAIEQ